MTLRRQAVPKTEVQVKYRFGRRRDPLRQVLAQGFAQTRETGKIRASQHEDLVVERDLISALDIIASLDLLVVHDSRVSYELAAPFIETFTARDVQDALSHSSRDRRK